MRDHIRSALVAYLRATQPPAIDDRERWLQCVAEADTLSERMLRDLRGEDVADEAWRRMAA